MQGPAAYVAPPGILLPLHAAYALNPALAPGHYQPVAPHPAHPAQPEPFPDDRSSDEDERQYETCTRCDEEFDPEDDTDSCLHHPGMLNGVVSHTYPTLIRLPQGFWISITMRMAGPTGVKMFTDRWIPKCTGRSGRRTLYGLAVGDLAMMTLDARKSPIVFHKCAGWL